MATIRKSKSKKKIPSLSLWGIDADNSFNALLFDGPPPENLPQYKPHHKKHFVLAYCMQGSFRSYIDFKAYTASKGHVALINPNQIHFLEPVNNKTVKAIIIAFQRSVLDKLQISPEVAVAVSSAEVHMTLEQLDYDEDVIPILFRAILKEFESKSVVTGAVVQLMSILLTKIFDQGNLKKNPAKSSFIYYSFLKLLDVDLPATHRVSDYAEKLQISEKTLNRACQAITNNTAQSIIHQKLNFEVKRQLQHDRGTAKEIAYSVGFSDPVQFSKFFKQHNGTTPLEYRKGIRTNHH